MNRRTSNLFAALAAGLAIGMFCPNAKAVLIDLTTDNSGAFNITAQTYDVTLSNPALGAGKGQTVHTWILGDAGPNAKPIPANSGIPVLRMRLTAGQLVTCNFINLLPAAINPEGASIHWHGIEVDNDSDGTAVTQDSVKAGQSYTYRFVAPRPGLFWFHSHMVPGDTLFAGMYGIIIVTDPCETALINNNTLPNANSTFQLAMSDIEWDMRAGLPSSGEVGRVDINGVDTLNPPNGFGGGKGTFLTIDEWIHDCGNGAAGTGGGQQNICRASSFPGQTVLVNGCNPDTMSSLVSMPVMAGQTVRLQLFNEALTRNFDLYLWNPTNNAQYPLVRIGGQGGLLNNARIEGDAPTNPNQGNDFGWVSQYPAGHISLSSGTRADAVVCIPSGVTNGTLILMASNNTAQWPLQGGANPATGFQIPQNYPIAFFPIMAGAPPPVACITKGTPIRAASSACCPIVNQTNGMAIDSFVVPPGGFPVVDGVAQGTTSSTITLNNGSSGPAVDGLNLTFKTYPNGQPLDGNMGNGSAWPVTPLKTDRYAYVGSLLVISVVNNTGNNTDGDIAHPYHLHGFSMQPLSMQDGNGVHNFNYNEFLDTIDIYSGQTYVFSVDLLDAPKYCDLSSGSGPNSGPVLQPCTDGACGGALGHWLYHCHIGEHGVLGMMGDIIVLAKGNKAMGMGQPPDTVTPGSDVQATAGTGSQTVADDFLWTNPGPITHVTVWGSWLNDQVDPNATFELKFWTDVPACSNSPSYPGWQAWEQMFPPGTYTITNYYRFPSYPFNETFVDPSISNCVAPGDTVIWQYDFDMPNLSTDFYPLPGSPINWLSVSAYTATNSGFRFGWKTTPLQYGWGDDSSWSSTLWGPPWQELIYPPCTPSPNAGASMNQAFQLYIPGTANCMQMTNCSITERPVVSVQPPLLNVTLSGNQVTITWAGGGTLQSAATPSGPWSVVPDSTGTPYLTTATGRQRFYRVVISP